MIRLKNSTTGRVVELTSPDEIAPADPSKGAKARADREASRQRRLVDTLRKSKRWSETSEAATPVSDRQRRASWEERERRRIEASLRAEYEQRLENERARMGATPASQEVPETPAAQEPTAAVVRAWAKDNGVDVPPKGKLPETVVAAYKQAQAEG